MSDIDILNLQDVLLAHEDQTTRYGGDPSVRDMGLLESTESPGPSIREAYLRQQAKK